jgi:UDP:flavonoid glycosyltransferase YjiC (YdhE family)
LVSPGFYDITLAACAAAGRPTLVAAPHRDLLPERLPPDVHWFRRLPFRAVMARAGAVVHHGGIGTAWRAICTATPQVILADSGDRPDNAERLAGCGLAMWLPRPEWSVAAATELLAAALSGPRVRPVRPPAADPVAAVVEALEQVPAG